MISELLAQLPACCLQVANPLLTCACSQDTLNNVAAGLDMSAVGEGQHDAFKQALKQAYVTKVSTKPHRTGSPCAFC